MEKIGSQKEYLEKVQALIEHDRLYYQECAPKISDFEYDQMQKSVIEYEKENPDLIAFDSPTQRVGEAATAGFKHGEHIMPMLSLSNTYNLDEVQEFISRVYKLLETKEVEFCVELKMDGTAISLRYEHGILTKALTRGNGTLGDDVTNNIKTIKSIPLQIENKKIPLLEVRGEVFMSKKIFSDLNLQREEAGEVPWANPRNAAAGSLKLLDPKEVAKRHLLLVCYGIAHGENFVSSQFEAHNFLRDSHLPVADEKFFRKCSSAAEILDFADSMQKIRENLSFEIDGIVIKVNKLAYHAKLGTTGKWPRYAVAYKFAPEQARTVVEDITVQVGRTGVLTPVAKLKPVFLAGSKIARATLHNYDEIRKKDIRIDDTVIIEKGGDVIPKVVGVDLSKRRDKSQQWHMPKECPVCKETVAHNPQEVAIRCPNEKCPGRNFRKIVFFASKNALNIENLGIRVIEKLIEKGLVRNFADIFKLTKEKLALLEGFKEKSISNLLDSIEKAKMPSLGKFILALGISHVGQETAELLADRAKTIENLKRMTKKQLLEIEGIGEIAADSVVNFFQQEENLSVIKELLDAKLTIVAPKEKEKNPLFFDKVFVLTGTLKNYGRHEAAELIKQRGGKVASSVSSNTDYVVVGTEPGSKYEKALKLNVRVLTEEEFSAMLQGA